MTKAATTKKDTPAKEPKAKKGSAPIAELPKGKGTQNDDPPASNPPPLERGKTNEKEDTPTEDTLRLQKDKARWEYGVNPDDTSTMLNEQRQIERNIGGQK